MQYLFALGRDSNFAVVRYSEQSPEDIVLRLVLKSKVSTSVNSLCQQRNFTGDYNMLCTQVNDCYRIMQKRVKFFL